MRWAVHHMGLMELQVCGRANEKDLMFGEGGQIGQDSNRFESLASGHHSRSASTKCCRALGLSVCW